MEGFLSTDAIKYSVLRCISKDTLTHFPGVARRNGSLLEGLLGQKSQKLDQK